MPLAPRPHWGRRVRRISAAWNWIARKRGLSILLTAVFPLLGRLALLGIQPIPVPQSHDEFSYLLAAATFAKGRLTNPTPPMWEHFETFHEFMQPTYMSIYPPAQGAMLAAGTVLFGDPWWAVWLSVGIMCAVLTWMLQAWLPAPWALLGGVLAGLQFGFEHYWMNGYWGGSVAAVGGCLVLGAGGRLRRHVRVRDSIALGAGLALMAASRPFEGMVLACTVAAGAGVWLFHRRESAVSRDAIFRGAVPALIVAAAGVMPIAMVNHAITGSFTALPHELYRREVAVWPTFVFERPRTGVTYRHAVLREFFEKWEPGYEDAKDWGTLKGLIPGITGRARMVGACYFPLAPYLPVALVSLCAVFFRKTRLLGAAVCTAFAANGLVNWMVPHYLAPVLGAMLAVHLQFLRFFRSRQWRGIPWGRWAFPGLMLFLLALFGIRIAERAPVAGENWALARARFERQLEAEPGQHLIFVQYAPKHILQEEWVYNGPDIPKQKVIWARSMTPVLDQQLSDYFHASSVWILEADAQPPRLTPRRALTAAR